jgi:hypothetical protein
MAPLLGVAVMRTGSITWRTSQASAESWASPIQVCTSSSSTGALGAAVEISRLESPSRPCSAATSGSDSLPSLPPKSWRDMIREV